MSRAPVSGKIVSDRINATNVGRARSPDHSWQRFRWKLLYLETDKARILIDAGFSLRQIGKRLELVGRDPKKSDRCAHHPRALRSRAGRGGHDAKLQIPIYCNRPTLEAMQDQLKTRLECRLFSTGASFELGDVLVETFSVPHDAQDPVGFLLRTPEGNAGFLTDLGHATKLVLERVRHANVLVLEANHDVRMLQDCPHRPWSLKQRILGRHGHLSNEAAPADAAEQIVSSRRAAPLSRSPEPGVQPSGVGAARGERAPGKDRSQPRAPGSHRAEDSLRDPGVAAGAGGGVRSNRIRRRGGRAVIPRPGFNPNPVG